MVEVEMAGPFGRKRGWGEALLTDSSSTKPAFSSRDLGYTVVLAFNKERLDEGFSRKDLGQILKPSQYYQGKEFQVEIEHGGRGSGLSFSSSSSNFAITGISEHGAVGAYNRDRKNVWNQIIVGDHLLSINDVQMDALQQAIERGYRDAVEKTFGESRSVKLRLRRPPALAQDQEAGLSVHVADGSDRRNLLDIFYAILSEKDFELKELKDAEHPETVLLGINWASDEKALQAYAERREYPVQLSASKLESEPFQIKYRGDFVPNSPAFLPFRRECDSFMLYEKTTGKCELDPDFTERAFVASEWTMFANKDKARLLWMYMSEHLNMILLKRTQRWSLEEVIFPMNRNRLDEIKRQMHPKYIFDPRFWIFGRPSPFGSLRLLKQYLGEHVGFYFVFVQYAFQMSVILALFGLLSWVPATMRLAEKKYDFDNTAQIFFVVPMCLFATCFASFWRRQQNGVNRAWGIGEVLSSEEEQLHCDIRKLEEMAADWNHCELTLGVDKQSQLRRMWIVWAVDWIYLVGVAVLMMATYNGLDNTSHHLQNALKGVIAVETVKNKLTPFIIVAVQAICQAVWMIIAPALTEFESYKYEWEYENALAKRNYLMNLFSHMFPLFYLAGPFQAMSEAFFGHGDFFQTRCDINTCMDLLRDQLRAFLIVTLAQVGLELLKPLIKVKGGSGLKSKFQAVRRNLRRLSTRTTAPPPTVSAADRLTVMEMSLPEYTGYEMSLDYLNIMVPVVMVLCFGVVDPLATPILLAALTGANMYVDSYKVLFEFRRPVPSKTGEGIGHWRTRHFCIVAPFAAAINWALFIVWHDPEVSNILLRLSGGLIDMTGIDDRVTDTKAIDELQYQKRLAYFSTGVLVLLVVASTLEKIIPLDSWQTELTTVRHEYQRQKVARVAMQRRDAARHGLETQKEARIHVDDLWDLAGKRHRE